MLSSLKLGNFTAGSLLPDQIPGHAFVLRTCQRTLVLSYETFPVNLESEALEFLEGECAYLFLLETICGLKSKLIGENEIVGQFKEAYKAFALSTLKDTRLLTVLEKLFKDAKDIRTQYLIGISQKTYASLTRKHLIQKARATHVVVLGSGQLAEDLINQFKKKATVSICARNEQRVQELAKLHDLKIIPWDKRDLLINEPFIANTIGADSILFDEGFFADWAGLNAEHMFVDLGSPSIIKTNLGLDNGIVRLEDIFNEGAIVEGRKQEQILLAREAMIQITHKRKTLFEQKLASRPALLTPQTPSNVRYL